MSEQLTTWRKELQNAFACTGESFPEDVEHTTLSDDRLDVQFESGYGGIEGLPFAIYTVNYVYFPACYDGSEWVAWIPRHPTGKPICHVGGG